MQLRRTGHNWTRFYLTYFLAMPMQVPFVVLFGRMRPRIYLPLFIFIFVIVHFLPCFLHHLIMMVPSSASLACLTVDYCHLALQMVVKSLKSVLKAMNVLNNSNTIIVFRGA